MRLRARGDVRVNPHLEHLLSRIYDGGLAPEHRADLRKSGLTDETIAANLLRSVPPSMIPRLLGFDLSAVRSALLFPFRAPDGGFMDHVRLKVFPTLTDASGHTVKYLQPKGSRPRVYFISTCLMDVIEGDRPLWVVEGEKKALAVSQLGLPAVGIAGVEGWHQKGSRALVEDFSAMRLRDRIVEVVPDADVDTNPAVRRAMERFGEALAWCSICF